MSDVLFWLLVTCNTTYACKTTSPFIVGGEIRLLHTSSGPTSSQFDTSGFEKPVAFSKVSENLKFHCELRYFHFTESLSVSCQERFQRLLRVAQAQRWRSLGFALEIIAEAVVKDSFFAADTSDFCLKCTLGNG